MGMLILGLVLFLGVHSVRIFANDWRTQTIAGRGEGTWKGLYSLLSIAGFGLIIWGYGLARQQPVVLWVPPVGMRHVAALLTLIAFVLLMAAYVPRNGIKARLHHPMVISVKVWAFAHLLCNGNLADVLLFGAFLAWAVTDRVSLKHRTQRALPGAKPSPLNDVVAVIGGLALYALIVLRAHVWLIGVSPLG